MRFVYIRKKSLSLRSVNITLATMKHLLSVIAAAAALLCSCSQADGDWEKMKWSSDIGKFDRQNIAVPAEGATCTFVCTNYSRFRINSVTEDGKYFGESSDDPFNSDGGWFSVHIEGNTMTVAISANDSPRDRSLTVGVTAGDIFSMFTFNQQPQE